jgi:hypothetical protein
MFIDRAVTRRYHRDEEGRSVLVGLTFEETSEFETLEGRASGLGLEGEREFRWHNLYLKHESAWKRWLLTLAASERKAIGPVLAGSMNDHPVDRHTHGE